jgi:hypothetical protein
VELRSFRPQSFRSPIKVIYVKDHYTVVFSSSIFFSNPDPNINLILTTKTLKKIEKKQIKKQIKFQGGGENLGETTLNCERNNCVRNDCGYPYFQFSI